MRESNLFKHFHQWKSWALAKSKAVAESFRRSPAWEPASRVGWNFYEITVSVLPYILGAQMLVDIFLKKWGWLCFAAIVSVLLAVASFMLHRIRRLRIDLEVKYRKMLQADNQCLLEENRKLKNVALSAVAIKLSIEHGIKPNLEPLTRYLDAFSPEEKPGTSSAN